MDNWKAVYEERLTTAAEAVRLIEPGSRVAVGHAAGEPSALIDAMVANKDAYRDVEIVHMVPMGKAAYAQAGMEPHFRLNTVFVGGVTRGTVKRGHGDFFPCYFHRFSEALTDALRPDAALIHVSPPDKHGWCSCGVSVDYTKEAAESAKTVIAQVNKNMPRTHGDTFLHVSRLHCVVEHDGPIIELAPSKIGGVEKAIGENCAALINDGDCLQIGIGAIPDAVLLSLKGKKDLGIHSEMISDGVVELAEAGVITNARKNFHKGVSVVTFMMGTRRLYDYADDNPAVNMYPARYVNDPYIAGQNDNLASINSCVQVDLLGQVCSEAVGYTQISGVGGQVDFVRAAALSKGGRSIIAMSSTAPNGASKIVPLLDEGAVVTTNRYDVQYIVTEYGAADLRFRTVKERAEALIRAAHPDFREWLKEAFAKRYGA